MRSRKHAATKTFADQWHYDEFLFKALHEQYPDAPRSGWLKPDQLRAEIGYVAYRMGWIGGEATSCDNCEGLHRGDDLLIIEEEHLCEACVIAELIRLRRKQDA